MNSRERVLAHLSGQPVDRLPLMPITMQFACRHIVEIDSLTPLELARREMPGQIILGNLNPVDLMLHGTPEAITRAAAHCHRDAGSRFIVGAGCEVPRDTPVENLRALCDYAFQSKP